MMEMKLFAMKDITATQDCTMSEIATCLEGDEGTVCTSGISSPSHDVDVLR